MKQILIFLLIISGYSAAAQKIKELERTSSHSILIKGDDFQGILFDEEPLVIYQPEGLGLLKRYSPIVRDALFAEEIMHKDQSNKSDYTIKDLFIKTNLKKYLRQYAGFINVKGEKFILVNLAWKKSILKDQKVLKQSPKIEVTNWMNEWYDVLDGGNNYGMVLINISTKKIIQYGVHGVG